LTEALSKVGGNQAEAAKLLGVSRRTFIKWLDKSAVRRPRKRV
jgi:DNA-binding protein Fis